MKNIALIGFMGTGKSSAGRLLARRLRMEFVETDALIEERTGSTIPQLFADRGEEGFREIEREIVKEITLEGGRVISFGGGVTLNRHSQMLIRATSYTVLLHADPEVLYSRIASCRTRPLARSFGSSQDLSALLSDRAEAYSSYDLAIDTGRTPAHLVA